jgi:hypothetical protein
MGLASRSNDGSSSPQLFIHAPKMGWRLREFENLPGFAVKGHPIANCTVRIVFVSLWLTR